MLDRILVSAEQSGQLLVELADLLVDELQLLQEHLQQPAVDWFELCASAFSPRLASKTVRNMHGCLRAVLNQGKAWELVRTNPAQGVRLPRKKARKPPVVLAKQDIRRVIEALPEPTKSIVTLVVVGSLRIGEVAALRWERIHPDRIEIVERYYEGEFDDTKTDAGRRSIPLGSHGILRAVLDTAWQRSKYRKPEDLLFTMQKEVR